MGIPKFYKWLLRRYPLAVSKVERDEDVPPVDNLYVDMNGLVHIIVHGNTIERHLLTSQMVNSGHMEELWCEIFRYLDDLVHIVNPRKFLVIALDSVTPVAKMNQQRSRRMRDLKSIEEMTEMVKQYGGAELFDINAISPGTEFMHQLNEKVDFFLQRKINEDPLYQQIKIVFSNANVPGEGEHKIMEFLRHYKHSPEYDPNTRHCIYGLDADLIMLALLSHEPNMILFREIVEHKPLRVKALKGVTRPILLKGVEYEIFYVSILREYFEIEYSYLKPLLPFKFNLERIIDDFIFFCLFVGNDFVPYLYTVDINYGSLDEIIRIYKSTLPQMKDYVTSCGEIQWSCAEKIFKRIGESELEKFQERLTEYNKVIDIGAKAKEEADKERIKEKILLNKKKKKMDQLKANGKLKEYIKYLRAKQQVEREEEESSDLDPAEIPNSDVSIVEEEDLVEFIQEKSQAADPTNSVESNKLFLEKFCSTYETSIMEAKRLYYKTKLNIDIMEESGNSQIDTLIAKYLEGLQWVLYYYYKGVQHWGWFYPYHYAPLISDISSPQKYFKEGQAMSFEHLKEANAPVRPFEQLLCILPETSKNLLPVAYHSLYEPTSEISDMYPTEYVVDFNGRVLPWEAIKLIPFIDLSRVLQAEQNALVRGPALSKTEKIRNSVQVPYQYIYMKSAKCPKIQSELKDFPVMESSVCLKQEFRYLPLPPGKSLCFLPEISPDTELPCYDFPSLKHLEIEGYSLTIVTHGEIGYDSIEIKIKESPAPDFRELFNKPVFIGYPFQREARVDAIINKTDIISMSKDESKIISFPSKDSRGHFKKALIPLVNGRLSCKGEQKFVCYCRIIDHVAKDYMEGGIFKKVTSMGKILVHSALIMRKRDDRHYLNVNNWIQSQYKQYPPGADCVILTEPYFGAVGQIAQGVHGGANVNCILRQNVKKDVVTDLLQVSSIPEDPMADCLPMRRVAVELGTSLYVLSRIISTVIVSVKQKGTDKRSPEEAKNEPRYNIGFVLRNQAEGVHIPYHVFYDEAHHDWMLSQEVVQYLAEYARMCPRIFEILAEQETRRVSDKIYAHELFPDHETPETPLKILLGWILSLPITKLPFIPSGSRVISPKVHTAILQKLRKTPDTQPELSLISSRIKDVFVETYPFWVRPFGTKSYAEYQIGDRVISIKTSGFGYVPFGCSGTIVGIYQKKIMVQFDKPLMTGSSYWGQCAKYCGKLLDAYSVLNISMKRRSVYKQPPIQGQPRPFVRPPQNQPFVRPYMPSQPPYYPGPRQPFPPHGRPRMPPSGGRGEPYQFQPHYPPQIRPRRRQFSQIITDFHISLCSIHEDNLM
eukprot:TRINITY_DN683_c0_g1_i1.p1 TRINITY_DN683_c0_g1~~TRINITY_DN683_c0_g1_i1.p1  ORF type:complete len:1361 (+),score=161.89 TRINITY_DN683_c0_g1_i1:90-4085(+)